MLSVRFLNRFTILSNVYALVDRKLLLQAGPVATSCSLSPGLCRVVLGMAAGPSSVGHHWGWGHMPGQALQRRTQTCFVSPGTNGNGPKSFRETPVYSRVRSKLQARLKMCCYSDAPSFCPHIACMAPPTLDTLVHDHFSRF